MVLIWGVIEGEFRPKLCGVGENCPKILPDHLVVLDRDDRKILRRSSSAFVMAPEDIEQLQRFCGIREILPVIGEHHEWDEIWDHASV